MKKEAKRFMIYAKIECYVGVEISADNLQEALKTSEGLKQERFVEINGEHVDSSMRITGVNEVE